MNRKAIDYLRAINKEKNKLKLYYNETEKESLFSDLDDNTILKKELLNAIQNLSIEHQMVIRLFYKENYNLKEISEILKVSVGTTKSRLFHAREKLKVKLKNRNYEE